MAFSHVVSFESQFPTQMLLTGEIYGFQYWTHAKESQAFGTSPLPTTRVQDAQIVAAHNEVDAQATFPASQAKSYLGMINFNPGATGAQPDFASTMPLEIQKAHQGYSARQMAAVLLRTYRESYRPSYYWETRNGVEDYLNAVNYPDAFFWSGRPHFDFSWNSQYPSWRARTQNVGFWPGDFSGWNSMDNQHMGHNHLRYAYELTGDPVLEDWLKYNVSLLNWNYFTDWLPNVEAERAFGRSVKEAIALTELFPDLPETTLLKPRIQAKLQVYSNAVTNTLNTFGNPAAVPFDANDARVNGGVWGPAQNAYGRGPFVAVGWMQGFVNEVMTMVPNPDLRILAAAETYHTATGVLKTYFTLPNPSAYITGGIGEEWQSGTLQLALKYPNAPGSQFVISKVKPILNARFQNGCGFPSQWFCLNDSFRGF